MGLSLSYELRLPGSADEARRVIAQLHEFAIAQSFREVFDVVELGPACDHSELGGELSPEQQRLLRVFGTQYGTKKLQDGREVWIDIPPVHIIAFGIDLAEGSEYAQLGLASHPPIIEQEREGETLILETDLAGCYSWTQVCKTQYAGLQQHGGEENFLKAHVGLVRVLDHAQTLGMQVQVKDDSGYWEHRDEERLCRALDEWNEMIAAFAGQLKDQLGTAPAGGISGPILTAPDFEHIEAKGLDAWTRPEGDAPRDQSS